MPADARKQVKAKVRTAERTQIEERDRIRRWHFGKLAKSRWHVTEALLVQAFGDDLWSDKFLQALRIFAASKILPDISFDDVVNLIRIQRDKRRNSGPSERGRGVNASKDWVPSDINKAFTHAGGILPAPGTRKKRKLADVEEACLLPTVVTVHACLHVLSAKRRPSRASFRITT